MSSRTSAPRCIRATAATRLNPSPAHLQRYQPSVRSVLDGVVEEVGHCLEEQIAITGTEIVAESLGLDEQRGALVASVVPGSPASKAGIRPGSVIQMVGQEFVESPDEVVAQVREAARRDRPAVLLLIEHRGETRFVAVEFAAA